MRNRPDREMANDLRRVLHDLAGRLDEEAIGLADFLRLLLLRDEMDDGELTGPIVMGWTTEWKKGNSSGDG